jgi:hypothetical protein
MHLFSNTIYEINTCSVLSITLFGIQPQLRRAAGSVSGTLTVPRSDKSEAHLTASVKALREPLGFRYMHRPGNGPIIPSTPG